MTNHHTATAPFPTISVGESHDFEYEPTGPGELRLEVLRGGFITSALVRVVR